MTRQEAEHYLARIGAGPNEGFPLFEAAIACALHESPFRDPRPARALAEAAAARLAERLRSESPDDALAETLSGDLRLNGDILGRDHFAQVDILDAAERRAGGSITLGVYYLHAARKCGLKADGVDFPNHFLLRVETSEGPVALDPFSQGRLVMPSELTRRALRAGLTPDAAERLDSLMTAVSDRHVLLSLQTMQLMRALSVGDYQGAERAALRRALLDPNDHRAWLDVAAAREKQGALTGALAALGQAHRLDGGLAVAAQAARERVRMQLN